MTFTAAYRPLIDVDAHVSEDPEVWTSQVPARWKELVPQVRMNEKLGLQSWYIGDTHITPIGAMAPAGWDQPFPNFPPSLDETVAGAHDARARLEYLDSQGIWAQVLYPNVGGFGSQAFLQIDDDELKLECVRIYNDWLTEWCSADPERLIAVTATPFWDIDATVAEVERCAAMGHRGVLFTAEPQLFDQPLLGDPHWTPLWRTSVATGNPISFHIGSADFLGQFSRDRMAVHGVSASIAASGVRLFLGNAEQMTDLLFSGVLQDNPELKVISVESGVGWMPFVAEAADYMFHTTDLPNEKPDWDLLPSEYLRRQVYGTVWFEDSGPNRLLDLIGAGNVLFETDYPHPACLYADIQDQAARVCVDLADADRDRVLWENAAALYRIESLPPAG